MGKFTEIIERAVIQPNGQFLIQSYTSSGGWLNDVQAVEKECLLRFLPLRKYRAARPRAAKQT